MRQGYPFSRTKSKWVWYWLLAGCVLFLATWWGWNWRYEMGGNISISGNKLGEKLNHPTCQGDGFIEYELTLDPEIQGIWVKSRLRGENLQKGEKRWEAGNVLLESRDATGKRIEPAIGLTGHSKSELSERNEIISLKKLPKGNSTVLRIENRALSGKFILDEVQIVPVVERTSWKFIALGMVIFWLGWIFWFCWFSFSSLIQRILMPLAVFGISWVTILPGPWDGWRSMAGSDLFIVGQSLPETSTSWLISNTSIEKVIVEKTIYEPSGNVLMEFILWAKQQPELMHFGAYFVFGFLLWIVGLSSAFCDETTRFHPGKRVLMDRRSKLFRLTIGITFVICLLPEVFQTLFYGAPEWHDFVDLLINLLGSATAGALIVFVLNRVSLHKKFAQDDVFSSTRRAP